MIWTLLIAFQAKHFLADYPFQGQHMLKKFKLDAKEWVPALSFHCLVHAFLTYAILMFLFGDSRSIELITGLAFLDFCIHFLMDRVKASPNMLGRFQSMSKLDFTLLSTKEPAEVEKLLKNNKYFWWSLGLDQGVHHLTHYLIIYLVMAV